jgi:hypothetical protein
MIEVARLSRFVRRTTRLASASALLALVCLQMAGGCSTPRQAERHFHQLRAQALRGTRATYCSTPRKAGGRVDTDRLVAELTDLRANTFSFCIHVSSNDWDDFKLFLPKARAKGIRVWASIVPPSESPPRVKMFAEPFRLDYPRWAVEFAKLSLQETNLVAWSIDDFTHNLRFYTPAYVRDMLDQARQINPRLAFVPCCYLPAITPEFATNYCSLLDGVLFPYRHESAGSNLKDAGLVESEIRKIKAVTGPDFPVVLDIYASPHSRLGATTLEYVEEAMVAGRRAADGVMIYRHQDPESNADKYQLIKRLFGAWAADAGPR